jgi:hypothetical protein
MEREIADAIPRRTIRQVSPPQTMPDYVNHLDGVTRVGALSAEAVARDYEAAAQEIEAMGKELVGAARKCEAMTSEVNEAIAFMHETASKYREEAKMLFTRIEECSIMTEEVRKTCQALKEKLVIGRPEGRQGTEPPAIELRSA